MSWNVENWGAVIVVAIMVAGACAVTEKGNEKIIEERVLTKIHPGVSTQQDVRVLLGAPQNVSTTSIRWKGTLANRQAWTYTYDWIFHKYGLIGRGDYPYSRVLTIIFTPEGVVNRVLRADPSES